MKTLITGGLIVNDGNVFRGSIIIENDYISELTENNYPSELFDRIIDAHGCFVLPGIIDEHVHFREPGLVAKADIESESRAAAYGGVTSFFDMPNTNPQTVSLQSLDDKLAICKEKSHINYSAFFGATNDNVSLFKLIDKNKTPGVKLFMGASTGNMLVDRENSLRNIFEEAAEKNILLMAHCENTTIINSNMEKAQEVYGVDPPLELHSQIRSREACLSSTQLAVKLAEEYGTRLHVAHVSTSEELDLFGHTNLITAEAVIGHLMFCDKDYSNLGSKIKCNPSIKTETDRQALQQALTSGKICTIATDHAPHTLKDKEGGCNKAASGMPMIQFSLPSQLELVDKDVLTIERVVELMCHNPARLFGIKDRGFISKGNKADITIVKQNKPWTVTPDIIQSKCKWSPFDGHTFNWQVQQTICNGIIIYDCGQFDSQSRGQEISFGCTKS